MNLNLIQQLIQNFKVKLRKQKLSDIDWLYERQFYFKEHPTINADNIQTWLAQLFSSDRTQRYWKRDEIRSAELMIKMALFDPEMVSTAFRDLFDEDRGLEGRIDRFKFYLDEMISRIRKKDKSFLESWHHQDNAIISYYLMMAKPTLYCYYTRDLHKNSVARLGAKPLEDIEDPVRYQKMTTTLMKIASKDEQLMQLHQARFNKPIIPESKLIIYELLLHH